MPNNTLTAIDTTDCEQWFVLFGRLSGMVPLLDEDLAEARGVCDRIAERLAIDKKPGPRDLREVQIELDRRKFVRLTGRLAEAVEARGWDSSAYIALVGTIKHGAPTEQQWDAAWALTQRLGIFPAAPVSNRPAPAAGPDPDTVRADKSRKKMPGSADVRDLLFALRDARNAGKSKAQIAREFTHETPGADRRAQTLLRACRRYESA